MGVGIGMLPGSDAASISWFLKGVCSTPSTVSTESLACINKVSSHIPSAEPALPAEPAEERAKAKLSLQVCGHSETLSDHVLQKF